MVVLRSAPVGARILSGYYFACALGHFLSVLLLWSEGHRVSSSVELYAFGVSLRALAGFFEILGQTAGLNVEPSVWGAVGVLILVPLVLGRGLSQRRAWAVHVAAAVSLVSVYFTFFLVVILGVPSDERVRLWWTDDYFMRALFVDGLFHSWAAFYLIRSIAYVAHRITAET